MRRQQQQQRAQKNAVTSEDCNGLDFFEAMGVGVKAVMENAQEQGLSTKSIDKLYVDPEAFDDVVRDHLDLLTANEEGIGNEIDGESNDGDSNDDFDSSKRVDRTIDKKEGDNFTITQHFIYEGTLQAFKEGTAPTSHTMVCSDMQKADHRPLVKESKITMIKNTTPFVINFKLDGTPSTNVQMDEMEGTHKKVTYKIFSDALAPMRVDTPIFTHGEDVDFELDDLQEEFAYTTEAEIRASVQFPTIQEFIGDKLPSPKEIEQYNSSKNVFTSAQQNFVVRDSPLGRFIQKNTNGAKVSLAWENKFPNHLLLPQREIESQFAEMLETIDSSPIGKMHGMTGTISRHDGKDWDYIPEGISEEEARHLLTTRQSILVTVEHRVQAYLGE
jgi:hypothetical protein